MIRFTILHWEGTVDDTGEVKLEGNAALGKEIQLELDARIAHSEGYTPGYNTHAAIILNEFMAVILDNPPVVAEEPMVN